MQLIDLSLRRNYLKTILLVVPTSSENLTSLLSPALGQYGLDIPSLVEQLSHYTRFFLGELDVRVFLTLFSDNTFVFNVVPISYHILVRSVFGDLLFRSFSSYEIYKVLYLYSFVSENMTSSFFKSSYLNLKGYLSSYNDLHV